MSDYLLIESRDPFAAGPDATCYGLARELAESGHGVVLYLVENGVLPARSGAAEELERLAAVGVRVVADDFSLRERGIRPERVAPVVEAVPIGAAVDALANGARAIWH